jgi:hypothetical protein
MKLEHFKNKLSSAPGPEKSARLVSTARFQRILLTDLCITLSPGSGQAVLHCAHRTSTASSCAFCEQEGHLAAPYPPLPLTPVVFVLFRCHKEP